jgi:sporulation protein YlmC with PRC-barrel domain
MEENSKEITDWQALVNKPVYSSDGKEVGIVSSVQPEKRRKWYHTDH